MALAAPAAAEAQAGPDEGLSAGTVLSPVLVIRQEELFDRSLFGAASNARREEASRTLIAENRQIEQALEAEELALTDRRAALPAEEFRALAEAFNAKVEGIRQAQDNKARAIGRARDEDRTAFLAALVPVLAEIMAERGSFVILDQGSVVLSFDGVDVTDLAVARIDARIGSGEGVRAAPPDEPEDAPPPGEAAPQTPAPQTPAPQAPAPQAP